MSRFRYSDFRSLPGPGDFSPPEPDTREERAFEEASEELGLDASDDEVEERARELMAEWQANDDDIAVDRALDAAEDREFWGD